jgi:hypothetical protein
VSFGGQLAFRIAGTAAVFAVVLFVPAETLRWPAGWLFLALMFAFIIGMSLWLLRFDPALLAERMTGLGQSGHERCDKVFLALTCRSPKPHPRANC